MKVLAINSSPMMGKGNTARILDPFLEGMCKNVDREFAGALLRPHGPALKNMLEMGLPVTDVIEAAKEAGRQLVEEGAMSSETLDTVSRELLPPDAYMMNLNQRFQQALDQLER